MAGSSAAPEGMEGMTLLTLTLVGEKTVIVSTLPPLPPEMGTSPNGNTTAAMQY